MSHHKMIVVTDMSNETLHNLTLVSHILQHGRHIVIMWSDECRAEHDGQVVSIHLKTVHSNGVHYPSQNYCLNNDILVFFKCTQYVNYSSNVTTFV